MEALTLGMLLLAAVLISAVIDQVVPKISLPLIQIGLGIVITLFSTSAINIDLDPDLFLVLFIAPLLYNEAKNTDKASLWRDRAPILSLAIGLVVATALCIGFAVHWMIPSISLAAAFALGGALGPTDAVAVSSLSHTVDIPSRQSSVLKGELLLNDASGIVSFQFALAASITGAFSLVNATIEFLIEFFGGLVFGIVIGYLANLAIRKIRSIGVESTTFHVLFEVFTPFLVYLIADAIHVSGIIAVVVAGLFNVISPRAFNPTVSRMNIVSSSVWRVLTFALNGIVFVLLGTQLPNAMRSTWDDLSIPNGVLIGYVIGITVILMGVRFLWVMAMDIYHNHRVEHRGYGWKDAKTSLVTTLCGAKGTITLSILFTIPVYTSFDPVMRFPQRNLIIFLACGVIVCTLLLATFVVPLLAPKRNREQSEIDSHDREVTCTIEILRSVIEQLTAIQTADNRRETQAVISSYTDRLERIKDLNDIDEEPDPTLHIEAIGWERQLTIELLEQGKTPSAVAYRHISRLDRVERLLRHGKRNIAAQVPGVSNVRLRLRSMASQFSNSIANIFSSSEVNIRNEELRLLQIQTSSYVINRLSEKIHSSEVPTEVASLLLLQYQRTRAALMNSTTSVTAAINVVDRMEDIRRKGLTIELEQIQTMLEDGKLSRTSAKRLRDNVYLMQLDLDDNV